MDKAILKRKLEEELKKDLLDLKSLREKEKAAISFEEYLRERSA